MTDLRSAGRQCFQARAVPGRRAPGIRDTPPVLPRAAVNLVVFSLALWPTVAWTKPVVVG